MTQRSNRNLPVGQGPNPQGNERTDGGGNFSSGSREEFISNPTIGQDPVRTVGSADRPGNAGQAPTGLARTIFEKTYASYIGKFPRTQSGLPNQYRVIYNGTDLAGRRMYRVEWVGANGGTVSRTVSWDGSAIQPPQLTRTGSGGISEPGGVSSDDNRAAAAARLERYIRFLKGDAIHAPPAFADTGESPFDDTIWGDIGSGGSGGGGFGRAAYRKPDRRVVRDFVESRLVTLIGEADNERAKKLTDLYMKDHRRNFDSVNEEIDPGQSVTEAIRETKAYQAIHALRPDGEDEEAWIARRRAAAEQGGLDAEELDEFAVDQATVGGDPEDVAQGAANTQLLRTGQAPTLLDNQFRSVAQAMFARVGR